MNAIKCILNKIKFIQIALITKLIFVGSIGFCSTFPWETHFNLTGSFAPIPIAVTLSNGAQTINHTGIEIYTDTACSSSTGETLNVGALDGHTFDFVSSTTYYLGLSATEYTSRMYNNNAHSLNVIVDADSRAQGSVCIPISCSSSTSCALTAPGPFSLTI